MGTLRATTHGAISLRMSSTLKDYFPVRREQGLSSLDVAVIGDAVQGMVAAAALAQLDFLTFKVLCSPLLGGTL